MTRAALRLKRPWPWMLLAGVKTSVVVGANIPVGRVALVAAKAVDMAAWRELVRSSAFHNPKADAPFHWATMPVGPVGEIDVVSCQRVAGGGFLLRVQRLPTEAQSNKPGTWR